MRVYISVLGVWGRFCDFSCFFLIYLLNFFVYLPLNTMINGKCVSCILI